MVASRCAPGAPVDAIERAVSLRRMEADDMPRTRELLSQLGYTLDSQELGRRFELVTRSAHHELIVAEEGGSIVAFCHIYARPALDKPPEVVVQALVVDQSRRGRGIGSRMMDAVEDWSVARKFTSVALASHVSRAAAHAFYEGLGYRCEATSHLFRKTLGSASRLD